MDVDGFIDSDLDGLEEGFTDVDGVLEAFEVSFNELPSEVRLGFDDADIAGEAVEGESIGDDMGLAVGGAVGEAVGDAIGLCAGGLVRGSVGVSAREDITYAVRAPIGVLVATGEIDSSDVGEDVLHLHFFIDFFSRSDFLHFFLCIFFSLFLILFLLFIFLLWFLLKYFFSFFLI